MKICWVLPDFPFPPNKGYRLQAYHHLRHLGMKHEIDLLTFSDGAMAKETGGLDQSCRRMEQVPLPRVRSLGQAAMACFSNNPLQIAFYRSPLMAETVEHWLRSEEYDVAIFTMIRMAQYRPQWYQGRTILNLVDPVVLGYQRSMPWRPGYQRPLIRSEISRLQQYEAVQVRRFDRALLINPADVADYAPAVAGATLDWVPHGVDADYFTPNDEPRRPGMIVISGNMYYPPNVDGVLFFCREVLPLIRAQEPTAHVCLVGARPALAVRQLAATGVIEVTGSVPDIRPYLGQAQVSVCPVRLKLGTQTKILEAMAMGTPVVTTAAGNHGVGGIPGEDLLVADDAPGMAAAVVSLLRQARWQEIAQRGRKLVVQKFSWRVSAERMENILMTLTDLPAAKTAGRA